MKRNSCIYFTDMIDSKLLHANSSVKKSIYISYYLTEIPNMPVSVV